MLLDAGAHIDTTAGPDALTPLMIAASQVSPGEGAIFLPGSTRPIDLARELMQKGANVNAQSKSGRHRADDRGGTQRGADDRPPRPGRAPSLISSRSQGKTAADIAEQNGAEAAAKALRLIGKATEGSSN